MTFEDIYKKILKSKHVFLTGEAGTGKTYNLINILKQMKIEGIRRAITASTGIAAFHINGMTIHRVIGFGIHETEEYLPTLFKKDWWEDAEKQLRRIDWLVIDEISMLSPKQFELTDKILKYARKSSEIFGGVKLLMVGDFLQLPPIKVDTDGHLFQSDIWKKMDITIINLKEVRRTKEDGLTSVLSKIRKGIFDVEVYNMIEDFKNQEVEEPVKIMATNREVDTYNMDKLNRLPGKIHIMNSFHTLEDPERGPEAKRMIAEFYQQSLVDAEYYLKVGARVMFIRNQDSLNIVNGDLGKVIDFTIKGEPIVKLDRGRIVSVHKRDMSMEDIKGNVLAYVWQQPLKLAYAVTAHKTQGMTLEKIEIDANNFFAPGQFYVALSRARYADGIKINNFTSKVVNADLEALEFYKNI